MIEIIRKIAGNQIIQVVWAGKQKNTSTFWRIANSFWVPDILVNAQFRTWGFQTSIWPGQEGVLLKTVVVQEF